MIDCVRRALDKSSYLLFTLGGVHIDFSRRQSRVLQSRLRFGEPRREIFVIAVKLFPDRHGLLPSLLAHFVVPVNVVPLRTEFAEDFLHSLQFSIRALLLHRLTPFKHVSGCRLYTLQFLVNQLKKKRTSTTLETKQNKTTTTKQRQQTTTTTTNQHQHQQNININKTTTKQQ